MHRKTILMVLGRMLMIMLAMSSLSAAARRSRKLANLKFPGTLSRSGPEVPGPGKTGPFTLQDIKAPYVLIEITRTLTPCVEQAPVVKPVVQSGGKNRPQRQVKFIAVGESDKGSSYSGSKPLIKCFTHGCPIPIGTLALTSSISAAPPTTSSWIRAAGAAGGRRGF